MEKVLIHILYSGDAYSLCSKRLNNVYDENLIKEVPVEDVTIVVTVTGEAGNRKYYFDGQETVLI